MTENNSKKFIKRLSDEVGDFTVSLDLDVRLYEYDIRGSKVHAEMLSIQNIITSEEKSIIIKGLDQILLEIKSDSFPWDPTLEDIHMNIESRLHEKIGTVAGKLHTARSRNDQISLDTRMFVKDACIEINNLIKKFQKTIVDLAENASDIIMPGYTHMQRAQPVLLAHHLLAYYEMFSRDVEKFNNAFEEADIMPLGSAALAGTPHPIDREYVAQNLNFSRITSNSIDTVSDRDFILSFLFASSVFITHISRFSEELILWSSSEFNFIQLSDEFTTGSSIMPQKRNPDFAEISRGKSGRVIGNLISLFTILKGLPLSYNRDLQEDKTGLFDSYDTVVSVLKIFDKMLKGINLKAENFTSAAMESLSLATDIADYLVNKGLDFRESYSIASSISDHSLSISKPISKFSVNDYKSFSPLFEEDVLQINIRTSVESRTSFGGTATQNVLSQIKIARKKLNE